MAERTGGQLLVDALAHQGVRTIFGIPGVQLDHAADALYQAADRISFFCARNEQATTYMADGYARSTGTPGVAMVVPGPGVLNALAGLAFDGLGLRALAAAVGRPHRASREDEFEQVRKWLEDTLADITPQRGYLAAIRSALPDDGVFVSEFTQVGYAASVCFPVYHPRGYIGPGYQGTLGYGFATALGAKAADPSRAVISVTGDGGFSWTMQELSTLRRYGLGMVTIVFNDGYFGNVRRIQKNRYEGRYFASDLTNPDYQQLAGAFGIGFACARDPGSLAGVLRDAVAASEPVLVEVPVGEFPSPWHLIHEGIPRPAPIAPGAHLPTERRHA